MRLASSVNLATSAKETLVSEDGSRQWMMGKMRSAGKRKEKEGRGWFAWQRQQIVVY